VPANDVGTVHAWETLFKELRIRLTKFAQVEEAKRQAAAEAARAAVAEAERKGQGSRRTRANAAAEAAQGVCDVDFAAASQEADGAFAQFKRAEVAPVRPLDDEAALAWLRSQPGARTSQRPFELAQRFGRATMATQETITIQITLPSSDEAVALAQLVKRIDYGTINRFASTTITYGGRTEADIMWSAVCALQRELAEAGFAPR